MTLAPPIPAAGRQPQATQDRGLSLFAPCPLSGAGGIMRAVRPMGPGACGESDGSRGMAETRTTPNSPSTVDESWAHLPAEDLRRLAGEFGVDVEEEADRGRLVELIRARQRLIAELDRDALLDVVVWGRRPVRRSASREELVRQIVLIQRTNYDSLSTRGLAALARLRGIDVTGITGAHDFIDRLRKADGFFGRLRRKGKSAFAAWVAGALGGGSKDAEGGEYEFLPEDDAAKDPQRRSLQAAVEEHGIVGGIAQRLRGAADDYIKIKLDEIESRIDAKLDQIDKRLGEWRDREVANRLRILRITLVFTVLVAVVSLVYDYVKHRVTP